MPLALRGQAELPKQPEPQQRVVLPKKEGIPWTQMLYTGGMVRHDDWFFKMRLGLADMTSMDYVNGISLGPRATIGKVLSDYSRIELDENVRWAFSREKLMARFALRYVFRPEMFGFAEIFGGKATIDYNRYPAMGEAQKSLATGMFGWSNYKLFEQTTVGVRYFGALTPEVQLTTVAAWEKRDMVENHRATNLFGKAAVPNDPLIHGKPMAPFETDKIFRLDWQIDYIPGRHVVVIDDLNAVAQSPYPALSIRATSGFNEGLRYLSLELLVSGMRKAWKENQQFIYQASAGYFPVNRKVLLMDRRHVRSSKFALQNEFALTKFSLLDDYELSTTKQWIEGHLEWNNGFFYAQSHGVKVLDCMFHQEFSTGITLINLLRVGCSVGFDDLKYDGIALNIDLKL